MRSGSRSDSDSDGASRQTQQLRRCITGSMAALTFRLGLMTQQEGFGMRSDPWFTSRDSPDVSLCLPGLKEPNN